MDRGMGKCLGENVTGNVCECLVACSVRGTTDTHTQRHLMGVLSVNQGVTRR